MKIKINVKEEHIINGECVKPSECAIALAVRDIIQEVDVYTFSLELKNTHDIIARFPSFVSDKIGMFDSFIDNNITGKERLEYLQPFSFVVDVDESLLFPDKLLEEIEQIIEGSNNVELVTV